MSQTIGDRVRFLRASRDWRQEDLAEKIGFSREVLSSIENNHRQVKAEELSKLAESFDISTDQLLGRCPLPEVDLEKSEIPAPRASAMRISVPAKNVAKFREVLLYILNKVGARSNVGETVLFKLLYFVDFDFYEKYEEQFIGATYKKNKFGPTPMEFNSVIDDMIKSGEVERVKSQYFQKEQRKYLPHREACLEVLTGTEVKLIDEVIDRLADKNASQISEYSHGDVPWVVTEDQSIIDYETVFYRTAQYSVRRSRDEGRV